MASVQFGLSSYKRARGDLPELPVVNMFVEEAPTEEKGLVLQSRPGLSDRGVNMGAGPVDCLFKRDLVLGSALFGVSDGVLYRGDTFIGPVDGDGPFSIAGYQNRLFVAGGESLWVYDGTTLDAVAFPDNAEVQKVIVAASRAVAIRKDTGQFYWSNVLDDTIDALAFATAENQPDRLLDMVFVDDTLILGGAETIEFWPNYGDAELPFQPLEGRVIEKGVKATGCMIPFASTFVFVSNQNEVCIGPEATVISNAGLEARIEKASELRLFMFLIEGTEFLALRMDGETQVWCPRSGRWSEFQSYGFGNWVPQCYAAGVFGSAYDGRTLAWGDDWLDLEGVLERRFAGGFPVNSEIVVVSNVQLRCSMGQTPVLQGQYEEPVVEMHTSRNLGRTWGTWRAASLGKQGEYARKAQWRACGSASFPGFFAEWRMTAPIDWRVSDVLVNEPYGGRSWR